MKQLLALSMLFLVACKPPDPDRIFVQGELVTFTPTGECIRLLYRNNFNNGRYRAQFEDSQVYVHRKFLEKGCKDD